MSKKKPLFTVGLFVVIGFMIGAGAIIWIGASKYFKKGDTFLTYFDESVQGLQIDSRVKYQGVDVGWVTKIDLAPDNRLVEVTMKININPDMANNIVAKLEMAGITGLVFVGLEHTKPSYAKLSPKINFPTSSPVIPSIPSEIQKMFAGIISVVEKANQIDFKGISDQIKTTAKTVDSFVGDVKMKNMVTSLTNAVANIEEISKKINLIMVEGGSFEHIIKDAQDLLVSVKETIDNLNKEISDINIAETTHKATRIIDHTAKRTKAVATEIQITSENLRRASETLENLLNRLNTDPSDIIFSEPPKGK
ncbi:MAG TPA: MlaD family protein [Syntrophorhabdaceae bacterium]|jgi:phospholipid/cholesterol/gamma-HCH transport system substrate-binding protein|nr:MlaD family protein [Syntrophorhabdaceae bacterium]HOS06330.1 MlaD family protein [Syntrophorhabdaceae bacterium]HPL40368.1 MlaD family protein [Syntrophorhabdaceae bacterium]HQM77015.1 MlaD family protein [Syntrophorhabdaceae bacterium]